MQSFYIRAHKAIHTPVRAIAISTTDLEPGDQLVTPWGIATIDHIDKAYTRKQNGQALVFYRIYVLGICKRTFLVSGSRQWLITNPGV